MFDGPPLFALITSRRLCGSTMERARFHGSSKSRSLVNGSGGVIANDGLPAIPLRRKAS